MKKLLPIITAALLILSTAGCININIPAKPGLTEAPSEAPVLTDAPAESPSAEPTETPTDAPVTGYKDYLLRLKLGETNTFDMDFDGADDTLFISEAPGPDYEELTNYTVTLKLGSKGDTPAYEHVFEYGDAMAVWLADCDPTDSRLEILITYYADGEYGNSCCLRVSDDGNSVMSFEETVLIVEDEMSSFTSEDGFPVYDTTDVFGTRSIEGRMTVSGSGFALTSEDYFYLLFGDPEYAHLSITLTRTLDVIIVNEDGEELGAYTVPKGQTVSPYRTDNESYLIIALPDGRLGKVSIEIHSWQEYGDDYGIFVNGINQDEYGEIPYAG